MTEYLIKKGKRKGEFGYGFPRPHARWCTRIKTSTISRYLCGGETVCIGIAADEDRPLSSDFRYPLVEWGVTEKDALAYCLSYGFDWGGLYEHMDRVSCWCCPLQGLDSARALRKTHPELWTRLLEMERACEVFPDTFRIDYSAAQLEKRFAEEDAQTQLELPEAAT